MNTIDLIGLALLVLPSAILVLGGIGYFIFMLLCVAFENIELDGWRDILRPLFWVLIIVLGFIGAVGMMVYGQ